MFLALLAFSFPLVHADSPGETCLSPQDLRNVTVDFVSNSYMQWSPQMANDAQDLMAKWPYRAVFCSRRFDTNHPIMRDEVEKTLEKCGPLLSEKPHTATKFGCACKHWLGKKDDFVQILCLFPQNSNN